MAGACVFPGGRLDEQDCDSRLIARGKGVTADEARRMMNEPGLADDTVLGLFFTGLRETFEEAGLLLASDGRGLTPAALAGEKSRLLNEYRKNIHDSTRTLLDMAEELDLFFALNMLRPYSHWITPAVEKKRYDTRFFLARMPRGQVPVHDAVEMAGSMWIKPADALSKCRNGEITLMPPTLVTLTELGRFSSIDDVFEFIETRDIYPIMPEAFKEGDRFGLKLPNDPEYGIAELKQSGNVNGPSRIYLTEKGWELT